MCKSWRTLAVCDVCGYYWVQVIGSITKLNNNMEEYDSSGGGVGGDPVSGGSLMVFIILTFLLG